MSAREHAEGSPEDVDARLSRFALTVSDLQERVVGPAHVASRHATSFHPRNEAGRVFYAEATAGLRRVTDEAGWRLDDTDNVARSISPAGDIVIIVTTGNDRTGIVGADEEVTTAHDHGPRLLDGVLAEIGYTFDEIEPQAFALTAAPVSRREVWLLLLHQARREVRIELSRPLGANAAGYPRPFAERIIVAPVPVEDRPDRG